MRLQLVRVGFLLVGLDFFSTFPIPEERDASTEAVEADQDSGRTLEALQADFRACDRDWDKVNDTWGGLKFLETLTPVSSPIPQPDARK
jgi:hypothetical protein